MVQSIPQTANGVKMAAVVGAFLAFLARDGANGPPGEYCPLPVATHGAPRQGAPTKPPEPPCPSA